MAPRIPIRERGKNTAYILPGDIEYIKAQRAYCIVHLKNAKPITISQNLHEFCQKLPPAQFCQVHRSYTVNLDEIGWYDNHQYLILKSGQPIPISEEGKNALIDLGFVL